MTAWGTSDGLNLCGACGRAILKDEPVLFVKLPGVDTTKIRCQTCAASFVSEGPPAAAAVGHG